MGTCICLVQLPLVAPFLLNLYLPVTLGVHSNQVMLWPPEPTSLTPFPYSGIPSLQAALLYFGTKFYINSLPHQLSYLSLLFIFHTPAIAATERQSPALCQMHTCGGGGIQDTKTCCRLIVGDIATSVGLIKYPVGK